jgi:hypothetical protein
MQEKALLYDSEPRFDPLNVKKKYCKGGYCLVESLLPTLKAKGGQINFFWRLLIQLGFATCGFLTIDI